MSCQQDPSENKEKVAKKREQHNYVVVLDLSDRLLDGSQVQRDAQIINDIYDLFLQQVKKNIYIYSKDRFRIVIPRQKGSVQNDRLLNFEDSLYVDMASIQLASKKDIRDTKRNFSRVLNNLYFVARFSNDKSDYLGSDIYGYLNDRYNTDDEINESNFKNFIFILTDGELYVDGKNVMKSDLKNSKADLSGTSVAILELNPSKYENYNYSFLRNWWKKWMKDLDADKIIVHQQMAQTKLSDALTEFVNSSTQSKKKGTLLDNQNKEDTQSIRSHVSQSGSMISHSSEPSAENLDSTMVRDPVDDTKNPSDITIESKPKDKVISDNSSGSTVTPKFIDKSKSSKVRVDKSTKQKSNVSPELMKPKRKYFADSDGDGLGNPNDFELFSSLRGGFVNNSDDSCPSRSGPKSNDGCPKMTILIDDSSEIGSQQYYVYRQINLRLEYDEKKKSDRIVWNCSMPNAINSNLRGKTNSATFKTVGKYVISCSISNEVDNFDLDKQVTLQVQMPRQILESNLSDIYNYGNYALTGKTSTLKESMNQAKDFINDNLLNQRIPVIKRKSNGIEFKKSYADFVNELMIPKRRPETKINDIKITEIYYDNTTGKISSFSYQIL